MYHAYTFLRLDLTSANYVHIIEPHWNPMAEAQAVDRIYRIGQKREVFITRYIVPNSIETVKHLRERIGMERDALI
jgi:SNF2 family DNA or RNA helicase